MELYDKKQVREVQKKALEILKYFQAFCNTYGIRFYVGSGCCIGAVRNKGFIPWDDDIDIFLLRDDYEKLALIWNKYADTKHYSYCRTNEYENYHDAGASIRDNYTTFINKHCVNEDINHGLQIDLIPIDKRATDGWAHKKQVFFAMMYSLFNTQRLPDNQGKLARILAKIIFKIIKNHKLRTFIWKYAENKMQIRDDNKWDGYTELVTGFKGLTLKYPIEFFSKPKLIDFESIKIPVYSQYEKYLEMVFGNYMELPPKEERIPKHNTVFVDMNNGYKKYRGKYYLSMHVERDKK